MFRNLQVVPKLVYGRGCLDQLDGIRILSTAVVVPQYRDRNAYLFIAHDTILIGGAHYHRSEAIELVSGCR